jgi:hypothetical protein
VSARKKHLENLDPELGVAMRALIPRHRQAVLELFNTRGNRTEALRRCGYGGTNAARSLRNLHCEASKFFADRRVRAAIREECLARLEYIEPEILENVRAIGNDEKVKPADRLRALGMIWDRSRPVESTHRIEIEHHLTNDERDVAHYVAMKKMGVGPDAFLRRFGAAGIARVEAMVAAEAARRQDTSPMIEGHAVHTDDAEEAADA